MNNLPNRMEIELTEQDVENNLVRILQSMSRIRAEAILNRTLSKESEECDSMKDEYLHLSHRLKNSLETLASDVLIEKMQNVVKYMNKDERLLKYDPLQDGYWEKHNPEFDDGLEEILIRFMKDDFNSLDSKHHILQAIKLLGIADSSDNERVKVFNTVLPYQGSVRLEKQGLLKKFFGVLFGSKYKVEEVDDLTVRLEGDPIFVEAAIKEAKARGYTNLRIGLNDDILKKLKEKHETKVIENKEYESPKWPLKIANALEASKIAYPILGSLPHDWQDALDNDNYEYSVSAAFYFSFLAELVLGSVAVAIPVIHFDSPLPLVLLGIPIGIDFIARFIACTEWLNSSPDNGRPTASIFTKIPLYPFELYYRHKRKKAENRFMIADVNLNDFIKPDFYNVFEYFNELASAELSEAAEKNLEWSASNHYSFAKIAKKELEHLMRKDMPLNKQINQNNRFLTYEKKENISKYVKTTSLFLGKGERYILSYITRGDSTNNVASVLREDISDEEKLKKIAENIKSHFAHLVKYEKNEKVADLEATP